MDLNVHNSNFPIIEINRTNIAIIPPKKITPSEWLIFLRNVIYKLISKTLANHLKSLLPQIIIENQSAFTWERVITDNVLVAFKLMHYLNHKTSSKDSFMVTTLDKSKALDKVKWSFIQRVMERLGFNARWINLIMQCISVMTIVKLWWLFIGN